jgi:hypothetical protein
MPAGAFRINTFITDTAAVRDILAHLGEATSPPRRMPTLGPPLWEMPDAGQGGAPVAVAVKQLVPVVRFLQAG